LENYKTIKELADELNVSKQTIQYHYQRLDANLVSKNANGINKISKKAEKIIISKVNKKKNVNANKETKAINKESTKTSKDVDSVYASFESKIEDITNNFTLVFADKDKQISNKDQQIEKLQKLLDQQQQLTLQSNKQIESLQQQLLLSTQSNEKEEETTDTKETPEDQTEPLEETVHEEIKSESKKWWQLWK